MPAWIRPRVVFILSWALTKQAQLRKRGTGELVVGVEEGYKDALEMNWAKRGEGDSGKAVGCWTGSLELWDNCNRTR